MTQKDFMTQKRHFKESEYIFLGKKDESRYLIKFIIDNMCFLLSMKLKKICLMRDER